MSQYWPHTCPVPGDGATVLPLPQMPPLAPVLAPSGHDGAWMAPDVRQVFLVYADSPGESEAVAWEMLGAWIGCRCGRRRG